MDFATRKNCFAIREEKKKKKRFIDSKKDSSSGNRFRDWKNGLGLQNIHFTNPKNDFATRIELCTLGLGSTGAIITYAVFTAKLKASAIQTPTG